MVPRRVQGHLDDSAAQERDAADDTLAMHGAGEAAPPERCRQQAEPEAVRNAANGTV